MGRALFDGRWELFPTAAMPSAAFLDGIDVLVYDTSERFAESWGRAVVEAMLTGAVPLVPADPRHHLHQLVPHGVAGFHCATRADFARYARELQGDAGRLAEMSGARGSGRWVDCAGWTIIWRGGTDVLGAEPGSRDQAGVSMANEGKVQHDG